MCGGCFDLVTHVAKRLNLKLGCEIPHPVRVTLRTLWLVAFYSLFALPCVAQNNYEIQVYPSETVAPKTLMVESHTNFTFQGTKETIDGVLPSEHALHETIELTQGITSWSEVGFYIFTCAREGQGWDWVGDHIRPRVRAPESWHWPVGASLSVEFGYQRSQFSTSTWNIEIRPIIDKQQGRLYWSVNPAFDRGLVGLPEDQQWNFEPAVKVSWDFTPKVAFGLEYYGGFGPVTNISPFTEQSQQFVPAFDLNVSPKWEINFGVGIGVTAGTDHLLVKAILGRRFDWGNRHHGDKPAKSVQP
jgi:hypothetical protein